LKNKIELLAPAGGWDSMQAAINSGADSVYFGIDQLNMRARATMNFTLNDIEEISKRCSAANVKTYITLNTIIYDHDLSLFKNIIDKAKEVNITAIIASDQAVLGYCHSVGMNVHISTQLNITNIETVKFYSIFSDVMVLSRELSLRQVKAISDEIKKQKILGPSGNLVRIEVFGHGALCMAVSGKCYLSLHNQNASANRGACIQNCRRKYKVIDIEDNIELEIDNEYIMSPKDLCTIDFLDKLIDSGVSVLKIEGRGKAPEYVATTIKCYREAIDSYYNGTYNKEKIDKWITELKSVFNRDFWEGYYLGNKLGQWTDVSGSKASEKKIFIGKGLHYYTKAKIAQFKIDAQNIKIGDKVLITGPTTGVVETMISELHVDRKPVEIASKGDECTFPIDVKIRASDRLYKMLTES